LISRAIAAPLRGLSPLARGTHAHHTYQPGTDRFIPAGAGNSHDISAVHDEMAVYPRWRGELVMLCHPVTPACGLSPLARGTRSVMGLTPLKERFIPAGAGNSQLSDVSHA